MKQYEYSRETILKKARKGKVKFQISVDFNDLVANQEGIDFLNEIVDDVVEDGYLLEDISYAPSVVHRGCLIITVNASTAEYEKGES